jgi:ketopantoate reductase
LSERFGASRLLGGQCIITATLDERGHAVLLGRTPTLTFGELNGASSKRTDAIATTMQDAGVSAFEDLRSQASERRNPFGRRLMDRPHGDTL